MVMVNGNDELYADVHDEIYNVQNYWLNEEYPYYVEKGLVEKLI